MCTLRTAAHLRQQNNVFAVPNSVACLVQVGAAILLVWINELPNGGSSEVIR